LKLIRTHLEILEHSAKHNITSKILNDLRALGQFDSTIFLFTKILKFLVVENPLT
jgi:hypothetical protein